MKLLTTKEYAEVVHLTARGVRTLIKDKRIKAVKVGRNYLIEEGQIPTPKGKTFDE